MKKRVAVIVQRYGEEVSGGGEYYAKTMAEHLKDFYDVDVITTTCLDYMMWDDFYPEGKSVLNGVRIIRFKPLHERDWKKFDLLSQNLYASITSGIETNYEKDMEWIDTEGPYSPSLIKYVADHADDYDVFIVITYIYYTAVRTLPYVQEKAIFIPTAHDDIWIRLSIYRQLFHQPRYFIFLTDEERKFVHSFFQNAYIPYDVIGTGVEIPDNLNTKEYCEKYQLYNEYFIFIGRVDISKNCDFMIESFIKYKKMKPSKLKLVLVGKISMDIPEHEDIVKTGFVSEEEKFSLLSGAIAMFAPSKFESLCIALLEAFAVGVPAIVNGECEILKAQCQKSNAGLYYTDYLELEGIMDYMLTHKPECAQMGRNGKEYIERNYKWEMVTKKFRNAVEKVSDMQKYKNRNVLEDEQEILKVETPTKNTNILPAYKTNNIAVCFSSSNYFSPILSVALYSLIANTSDKYNYDIIIFVSDMSLYNRNLLLSMIKRKKNISLRFVNVVKILEGYDFSLTSYYTQFTYYRLLIPQLMSEYCKVLYLDSDIVINHDVAELYNTDIADYFLAATRDLTVLCWQRMDKGTNMKDYLDELGLKEPGAYMQGGVSLYNVSKFREELPTEILLKKATERSYLTCDQDLMNICCKGKIKFVEANWNMVTMHPANIELYHKYMPDKYYDAYIKARKDPYIIHYGAQLIPCFQSGVDYFHFFWEYARNTPFYEELIAIYIEKVSERQKKQSEDKLQNCPDTIKMESSNLKYLLKYSAFRFYTKLKKTNFTNIMSLDGRAKIINQMIEAEPGSIVYGPYITLGKGKHKLLVDLEMGQGTVELTISADTGNTHIATKTLRNGKNYIFFKNLSEYEKVEFSIVNSLDRKIIIKRIICC